VRPPKNGHPIKFKCFRCGKWGDEFDLLRLFHPADDYSRRRDRLDQLRKEYDLNVPIFHRGPSSTQTMNPQQPNINRDESGNVELAWANLIQQIRGGKTSATLALKTLNQCAALANLCDIRMEALQPAWRAFRSLRVQDEIRRRHAHLPYLEWPEGEQNDFLMACAREEAENVRIVCPHDPRNLKRALHGQIRAFCDENMTLAVHVVETCKAVCDESGVSIEALLEYWNDFERWQVESEERRRAECDDPRREGR
jgi:hypothetical protein